MSEQSSEASSASNALGNSGEAIEPRHVERLLGNKDAWKLTCPCGKRIVSPAITAHPVGRCPKCGRLLRLPGYRPAENTSPRRVSEPEDRPAERHTQKLVEAEEVIIRKIVAVAFKNGSEGHDAKQEQEELDGLRELVASEEDVGTIVIDPLESADFKRQRPVKLDAARNAADRLRAHKASHAQNPNSERISAWPTAGKFARFMAGFIDLTLATLAAALILILARLNVLPPACLNPLVAGAAFFAIGIVNDCLFQAYGGGLGKRLVILTLRMRDGSELPLGVLFARGILKWMLLPGWLLALFDPGERTLHDLICNTAVLKARR